MDSSHYSHGRAPSPLARIKSQSSAFFDNFRRPPTAYDAVGGFDVTADHPEEEDARVNGVRVWYSSFTSIDWLHDAVSSAISFSFDANAPMPPVTYAPCLFPLPCFCRSKTPRECSTFEGNVNLSEGVSGTWWTGPWGGLSSR